MNSLKHHALRLAAIAAFAIAVPQLALASETANGTIRLAMGPTSAAQKNQAQATTPSDTTSTVPKGHHSSRHKSKTPAQ